MKKIEIRFAGTGGQGVILASVVLAEAAGVYEGWQVVQTQSYGPEARGGASKADVIISNQPILFPKCRKLDFLVSLSQSAVQKYIGDIKVQGLAVIDSFYVRECSHPKTICLPFTETARRELGRELFTNLIAVGAVARLTGLIAFDSLQKTVTTRLPKQFLEINVRAMEMGWKLAEKVHSPY
ncbi:MAG: 2-oxoacid:acceptor oxidoreductase family protein [bacterium]